MSELFLYPPDGVQFRVRMSLYARAFSLPSLISRVAAAAGEEIKVEKSNPRGRDERNEGHLKKPAPPLHVACKSGEGQEEEESYSVSPFRSVSFFSSPICRGNGMNVTPPQTATDRPTYRMGEENLEFRTSCIFPKRSEKIPTLFRNKKGDHDGTHRAGDKVSESLPSVV